MKHLLILAALLLGGILVPSAGATAADLGPSQASLRGQYLPFPRSDRAQAVWASRACWSDCGSYCAWEMAGCLKRDSQGACLKLADACDRSCQRQCRTRGGPLLALEFPGD